jgi:hypothetical protein
MIIFDEIINNGSGLYIVFEEGENGQKLPMLTRLVIPEMEDSLFTAWKEIFDGTITTYGLDFTIGANAYMLLDTIEQVDGEVGSSDIPNMMKAINWDKVVFVKYLDHKHAHLYAMIIEAGSTIKIPEEPSDPQFQ